MSLDTNALLKSAGIGAGVLVVLAIISGVASLAVGPAADPSIMGAVGILSMVCCCVGLLLYAAVGVGYAWFAQKNETPLEPGPMALGGGLAALIAGVVQGVVNSIFSLITGSAGMADAMAQFQGADLPPEFAAAAGGGAIVGVCIGLCVVIVLSAGLGAAGGAIYAAAAKPKEPAPAA